MTERERACLIYLDDKMFAPARMIGKAIIESCGVQRGGSGHAAVGAGVAGSLKRRGFVTRLPDMAAWRITRAGREALTQ